MLKALLGLKEVEITLFDLPLPLLCLPILKWDKTRILKIQKSFFITRDVQSSASTHLEVFIEKLCSSYESMPLRKKLQFEYDQTNKITITFHFKLSVKLDVHFVCTKYLLHLHSSVFTW